MLQTPYFMIDKDILEKYYLMLEAALKQNWNNYIIGYSFKTNSLPWLIQFVKEKGAYAEVVSEDEYLLAKYLGYEDNQVVYNGPCKTPDSFEKVLIGGGYLNIDSFVEIDWLKRIADRNPNRKFEIGIRVNFDLEKSCPGETTMGEKCGRFGFSYENGMLKNAIDQINSIPNIELSGLHMHSSTKSRSLDVFRTIAKMSCQIKEEFSLNLKYIDLGGGYCGGMRNRPEYPDYFPIIADELAKSFSIEDTKIIVEPGISLISKCTTFVTSVYDVKDIKETRFVMTDGSRFNIDATMIKSSYLFHINYKNIAEKDRKESFEQIICGYTCMECDRLFVHSNQKELVRGDQIVYENVGGYTMSLNPLFIQYFPPVYVKDKNEIKLVRRKWKPEDYVRGSIIE